MQKNIYLLFLVCFIAIFTACFDSGGSIDNSIDDPIIILTCSEGAYDKKLWTLEVDKIFETYGYTVKSTFLRDSEAAAEFLWNEEHNGKFLLTQFEEALYLSVRDGSERSLNDWEFYVLGKYPEIVCVRNESGISSADELISEIINDTVVIASTNGHSELCTKLLLNLINKDYSEVLIVPQNEKGAPLEYIDEEIEAIVTTPNNISKLVEEGGWIPVCVISEENYISNSFNDIPSIVETIPEYEYYLPLDRLFGIMIPIDTPEEVKTSLMNEIIKQYEDGLYNEFFKEFP